MKAQIRYRGKYICSIDVLKYKETWSKCKEFSLGYGFPPDVHKIYAPVHKIKCIIDNKIKFLIKISDNIKVIGN